MPLWVCGAASGLYFLWRYDNTPGEAAQPQGAWPAGSRLTRAADRPTLVMLAHPQCTCTRASLAELAEVLARAEQAPKTYVVFLKPSQFPAGWEQSDTWLSASRLKNVTVVRDDDGREAQAFGAATSGQTLLYDAAGALLFSGGLTGARAHQGDNAGRRSVVALLNNQQAGRSSNVFGCPLFAPGN